MKAKSLRRIVRVRSYSRVRNGRTQLVQKHVRSDQRPQLPLTLGVGTLPLASAQAERGSESSSTPALGQSDGGVGRPLTEEMRASLRRLMEGDAVVNRGAFPSAEDDDR